MGKTNGILEFSMELLIIESDGAFSDAELHAEMLENNPDADTSFAFGVIHSALMDGMRLEDALRLYWNPPTSW
jgi:hypothetical protein